MKRIVTFLIALSVVSLAKAQQQIILFADTIQANSAAFSFTSAGPGSNTGDNSWVVNSLYDGAPLYGNTPPQDSVLSGTINGAPHTHYLHIRDAVAETSDNIANCNWNTAVASDRFASISNSYCTLGLTDVTFTFFWIGEGNANAYGEVYYRRNGGTWTKTGQAKYNNQAIWKYEVITDTAFNNAAELEFGFRWVNTAGGVSNISFGVDDIVTVGTFAANANTPSYINISQLIPTTVCQDNFLTIVYSLDQPLCDGTYQIEMSDANGSFTSPYIGGVFNVFADDTAGAIGFQVPNNVSGSCFKVRINRLSPAPVITGLASACFSIIDCPETITTVSAPVMTDIDTACVLSVIDVKFNSVGVFGPGSPLNVYTAQLSNANGSFVSPYQLGTLTSDWTYPGQPGNISGLIPANVPAGCGYYIRVVSSMPAIAGDTIGPFCITRCDILTNDHDDLKFCIPQLTNAAGLCDILTIHANQWNQSASYDTCNNWTLELRSTMNFSLVNSGGLATYHDNADGTFSLCMPSVRDSLPVPPGNYYMRMVSTCSSQPWNQTGTVVRITIGAPDTTAPQIIIEDTVVCNVGLVPITVNPFKHPPSDYEWASNLLNGGNAFTWPYNPLLINLDPNNSPLPGRYAFYVREKNFGCYGPYSNGGFLIVYGAPDLTISGPDFVCPGDTVVYATGYYPETFYDWSTTGLVSILNEGNNESGFVFNSLSNVTLENYAINECGSDSATKQIVVNNAFAVNAGADHTICLGAGDTLNAIIESAYSKMLISSDSGEVGSRPGAMFNIVAHADVTIDSFAVKYTTAQPVQAQIYGKPGSYRGFEQNAGSWTQLGSYFNFNPSPVGQFSVIPIPISQQIASGDTFAFYVTSANVNPVVNQRYCSANGLQGTMHKSDGVIDIVQGTVNNYPFGTFVGPYMLNVYVYYSTSAGIAYVWNTGEAGSSIQFAPQQSGQYSVIAYDSSGCRSADTVQITVIDCTNGIESNVADELLTVIPNPSNGNVYLKGVNGFSTVTLVDMQGKQVFNQSGYSQMLDFSEVAGGIYLLSVSTDNRIFNRKIVIQK